MLPVAFPLCPDIREWSAMMLYVENDRDFLEAVSRALGESRSLIQSRGFHLIEIVVVNEDDLLLDDGTSPDPDDSAANDTVDLAAVTGLDWDAHDDSRLHRRTRCRRPRRVA